MMRCYLKGIMFKPDMQLAVREGRKTQTRRKIKPYSNAAVIGGNGKVTQPDWVFTLANPHYQIGEVVYIKEAWWTPPDNRKETHHQSIVSYRAIIVENAGEDAAQKNIWLSPLFMPAWAARDFIQITGVRVERLQAITEADCIDEGCPQIEASTGLRLQWYKELWDSINPKYPWASNPFVLVYDFKNVEKGG